MIHEVADAVRPILEAKRYPYPVLYGPEHATRKGFLPAIVFDRDRDRVDGAEQGKAWKGPATAVYFSRRVYGRATVYARNAKPGARIQEHETECDLVVAGVLCALYHVLQGFFLQVDGIRLMKAEEFNGEEVWPGCAQVISFSALCPVRELDYLGNGAPTGVVEHTTPAVIRADSDPDYDPDPDD